MEKILSMRHLINVQAAEASLFSTQVSTVILDVIDELSSQMEEIMASQLVLEKRISEIELNMEGMYSFSSNELECPVCSWQFEVDLDEIDDCTFSVECPNCHEEVPLDSGCDSGNSEKH